MQITLDKNQTEILSELTGLDFGSKLSNNSNQKTINSLLEQGKINAESYLARKKLGQKLDIFEENNLFNTLVELKEKLNLDKIPRRIECFDISHLNGQFVYGSMVVFIDGIAKNSLYKVFKCPSINNDFANHKLVLTRRLGKYLEYQKQQKILFTELENLQKAEFDNLKVNIRTQKIAKTQKLIDQNKTNLQNWNLPDLIIVDGGKGQLSVDFGVLCEFGLQNTIEIVSLAKREEEIFTTNFLDEFSKNRSKENLENVEKTKLSLINLGQKNHKISSKIGSMGGILLENSTKFLVQRIRDEAHRFAIKHNRNARIKNLKNSDIDKIIGPKTKMKLLTKFGSLANLSVNLEQNLELVSEIIGPKIIQKLQKYFQKS